MKELRCSVECHCVEANFSFMIECMIAMKAILPVETGDAFMAILF